MSIKPVDIYTSTSAKYYRHPELIKGLREGKPHPISLQVSPTNKCNIQCQFCSVDERKLNIEWNIEDLKKAIFEFICLGIKTVELSGGGDPTLFKGLPDIVEYCKIFNLKLGLITNGILLKDLPRETLEAFTWIRISVVTLDYKQDLKLPDPWPDDVILGMSYVLGQINYTGKGRKYTDNDYDGLLKAREFAIKHNAIYLRCVPECLSGSEEKMTEIHKKWIPIVEELGPPLFFQTHKWQKQAECCYIDMVKPWMHSDGFIYPCNSVSLNTEAHRDFDKKWRLCHWTEIRHYYENRGNASLSFIKDICDQCSFTQNNTILKELIEPMEMEEFV